MCIEEEPDYINVCQCLIFHDDTQAVADILDKLTREGEVSLKECKKVHLYMNLEKPATLCLPVSYLPG